MVEQIRLFEKNDAGLLVEVDPENAASARAERRCSRVVMTMDLLWTATEEAERDEESIKSAQDASSRDAADQERATNRGNALQKLRALGLTDAEVVALVG